MGDLRGKFAQNVKGWRPAGRTVQRAQQIYVDKLATEGHEQAGERRNVDLVQQNGRQRFRSRLRGNLVRNKNLQPLRMYGLC